jgi:signal peptidase I
MTSADAEKPESRWGIGALVAFSFVLMVLLLSTPILFRAFLFQPFNTPSNSMAPTLLVGDYFFVAKYAYGRGAEPTRGDVVGFLSTKDHSTVFVKRVVGLPGERIQMKDGLLHINGVPVARERLANFTGGDPCGPGIAAGIKRWRETLPNGVSHETLDCQDNGFYDNTVVYTVPSGQYFMLGDNRDNSTDSRVLSAMGYIPLENIIGRAAMIFYSAGSNRAGAPEAVRTERLGTIVR